MKGSSTTTCRSSGIGRRIALGAAGLALAGLAAPAAGQGASEDTPAYPLLRWTAHESLFSHQDADDEAMDMVYWEEGFLSEPDKHWIYVTGFVTEMDGDTVVGTRFATFKYDGEFFDSGNPPPPAAVAYFPDPNDPTMPLSSGEEFKAVAMAVNPDGLTPGDIYVVGQAPRDDSGATTDLNYCVIKYSKDLVQQEVYYYDGPVSGDDLPVDIVFAGGKVMVTGTSPGDGTGKDIATIALKDDLLPEDDRWPDNGWGDGVRRYNYVDGDDLAVEIGPVYVTVESPESAASLNVVILGTSWGGASKKFDYTTHGWGSTNGIFLWDERYDNGANDVATGITGENGAVWVTGWSEVPSSSFGPTGPDLNADYLTISYGFTFCPWPGGSSFCEPEIWWTERWDVAGGRDFPADIQRWNPFSGPDEIWVTGTGFNGSDYDAATVFYEHDFMPPGPLVSWTDTWGISTYAEAARAMAVPSGEPYTAGRQKGATFDRMLGLKYEETSSSPPVFAEDWYKLHRSALYDSGVEHEGRVIVVTPGVGVFIAGVSKLSGEGREFTTWRYEE